MTLLEAQVWGHPPADDFRRRNTNTALTAPAGRAPSSELRPDHRED